MPVRLLAIAFVLLAGLGGSAAANGVASSPPQPVLAYELDGWIYRAHVDGSSAHRLLRGEAPDVSPDGRWIAFFRQTGRYGVTELFVLPTRGGKPAFVRRSSISAVSWLPDSRGLLVADLSGINVVGLAGSAVLLAPRSRPGFGTVGYVALAPDGSAVVFSRDRIEDESVDVYSVQTAGGEERRLTSDGASDSPLAGAREIAFERENAANRNTELWLMDLDGSNQRRLGSSTWLDPVFWTADGTRIVAWDVRLNLAGFFHGKLWAVDAATGAATPLYRHFIAGLAPLDLSADGRILAVRGCYHFSVNPEQEPGQVEIVRLDGSKRVLVKGACSATWNA